MSADWPEETARRFARELSGLRARLYENDRAALRPQDVQQLEALGYVDGTDEE